MIIINQYRKNMEGFEYIKNLCQDSNCIWPDKKDVNI